MVRLLSDNSRAAGLLLWAVLLYSGSALPAEAARRDRYPARWWWDAVVRLQDETHRRQQGGGAYSNGYSNAVVKLGINGSIYHPNFLRFRLTTDLRFSRTKPSGRRANDYGLGGNITLFPRGRYKMDFWFVESFFDFDTASSDLRFSARPDRNSGHGGTLQIRSGPFRGLLASFTDTTMQLDDPDRSADTATTQKVQWHRELGRVNHSMHLSRSDRSRGITGIEQEDLRFRMDDSADFGPWRWRLFGDVWWNSSGIRLMDPIETRSTVLSNNLHRVIGSDYTLTFDNTLVNQSSGGGSKTRTVASSVGYTWKAPFSLYLGAFLRFNDIEAGTRRSKSPSFSINLHKDWSHGRSKSTAYLSAGRVLSRETDIRYLEIKSSESYSASYRLKRQGRSGGSQFVHLRHSINDGSLDALRDDRPPGPEFTPEIPASIDVSEVRVGLERYVGDYPMSLWGRWARQSSRSALDPSVELERTTYSASARLQASGLTYQLTTDYGQQIDPLLSGARSYLAVNGRLNWRPYTFLSVFGFHQYYESEQLRIPKVNGNDTEIGVQVRFNQLDLELKGWIREEQVGSLQDRTNQGVMLSIGSQFAGWLPVTTGIKNKGFIR